MSKNWSKYKLSELGSVGRGRSKHRPRNDPILYGGKYPFFQTADVKNTNLYLREFKQTYNEIGLSQSKLWKAGTLLITIAANIAETSILMVEGCFPDSIIGFIPFDGESDVRFIKYHIDMIKLSMQSIAQGTTQDNLSIEKLLSFDFFVPPYFLQKKIASILSAYDELIENNTRRIKILEEMAQRIYREWFVHFRYPGYENQKLVDSELGPIPERWEVKELGEKINFRRGKNVTKKKINSGNIPVVAAGINPAYYHNKSNVSAPVVTISASGANAGYIKLYLEDIWASDCSYINKDTVDFIFYYYSLLKYRQIEITVLQRGSAQPHVYPKDLIRLIIIDPSEKIVSKFEEISKSIFEEIGNLKLKNTNLSKTRDLLLPKLISGKIDVSDLDIDIGTEVQ